VNVNYKTYLKVFIISILIAIGSVYYFTKTSNIVYVYNDDGVGEQSWLHLMYCLKQMLPDKYYIKTINATEVKSKNWTKNAALFVMPGGADIPYTKKLNGVGNKIIKDYVANGGTYLGICAGSYYGSGYVEFDKGGELEVLGSRELAFFPGKAIGPAIGFYNYKSNIGAQAANISVFIAGIKKNIHLFLHGGPYFANAESFSNVSVIGWYKIKNNVKLPAIIHIKYGKGNVVLSGVHFEYEPNMLDKHDKFLTKLIPQLDASNEARKVMIGSILVLVGILPRGER